VRAPVLILNADRSNVLGADQAAKLATDFANARLIMVPDSNHTIWGDQPEFLAARVREFLTDLQRG
jgi:pimeloyl-ACP methyl ester carboxylesterase